MLSGNSNGRDVGIEAWFGCCSCVKYFMTGEMTGSTKYAFEIRQNMGRFVTNHSYDYQC